MKKFDKIDRIMEVLESDISFTFDSQVYLPVKRELTQVHSLGVKKELWKQQVADLISRTKSDIKKNTVDEKELLTAINWAFYCGLNNVAPKIFKTYVKKRGWK